LKEKGKGKREKEKGKRKREKANGDDNGSRRCMRGSGVAAAGRARNQSAYTSNPTAVLRASESPW
jgi:hypothetical protein